MAEARFLFVFLIAVAGCGASGRNGNGPSATCTFNGQACEQTCCGKECVDTDRDPLNCGACGTACPSGTICLGGRCGCPPFGDICGAGQSCCGSNGCVSLGSDIRNCGGCGVTCPDGVSCTNGSCAGATTPTPPPAGFCTCSDSCASDTHHECIGPNCCYDSYVDGQCTPATSCGIWTYQ